MNNRYLCRAKKKNWRELPKYQWWVEGYYVELPVGSIAATIVANDEEVVCEDVESYIIRIYTKQHSNFSPGFPMEVVECEQYEIDFDTLCRCTGLRDRNRKLIFENDIMEGHIDEDFPEDVSRFMVEWSGNGWIVNQPGCTDKEYISDFETDNYQVVGNVFDNPKMLKV